MNTDPRLTIGVLSDQTAVRVDTIRFYERIGILPKPPRSAGGHRLYANEHKQRLVFIRRARELGFLSTRFVCFLSLPEAEAWPAQKLRASPNSTLLPSGRK